MLHLGLALAAQPDPLWQTSHTGASALVGAERLQDTWSPAVDLRGSATWGRSRDETGFSAGAWGSFTALPATNAGWLDAQGAWADARRGPALAEVWLRSGALTGDPWLEAATTVGAAAGPFQLTAGPAIRGGHVGGIARATVWGTPGDQVVWLQVEGRLTDDSLPNGLDALGSVRRGLGPWDLSAGAGVWMSSPTADNVWVAGTMPDTRGVRGLISASRDVGPVAVQGELSGTRAVGAGELSRIHGVVGVAWGRGHTQPVVDDPGAWHLVVHLPHADRVELAGTHTNWQPVPLEPGDAGTFSVTLDLPPGRYELVLLVDGLPVPIPGLPTTPDGFGGENAILTVE